MRALRPLVLCGVGLLVACQVDFSSTPPRPDAGPFCGNGAVDPTEACDGSNLANHSCLSEGFESGALACTADCHLDPRGCLGGCGNGVVEAAEACDDATANSDTTPDACREDCTLPVCGDGVADASELCDGADLRGLSCDTLGLEGGALACSTSCAAYNVTGCDVQTLCGNDTLDPGEVCDGADLGGVDCVALGYASGSLSCAVGCQVFDESDCLGAVGTPCSGDAECDSGTCLTESVTGFPGGMCSRDCAFAACPTGEVCGLSLSGQLYCAQPCFTTAECRPGYACIGDGALLGESHCMPLCGQSSDCSAQNDCNRWTGLCGDPLSGAENGAACTATDDCRGKLCTELYPGGYCVSLCDLTTGLCPGDNECTAVMVQGSSSPLGVCFDGCLVNSDCLRPGYSCEPNVSGSGSVCIVP